VGERGRRIEFPADDPIRQYCAEELRRLSANLLQITEEVHALKFVARTLDRSVLEEFHARIFLGVRQFAGRIRSPRQGSERLIFGPNRSLHRDEVPTRLESIFAEAARSLSSIRRCPEDPTYELAAIRLAVWLQAEIIRVHPFEDGNGRAARLLTTHVLVSLGLAPIPVEACRQEYVEVLNAYYAGDSSIDPLVDLYIRVGGELSGKSAPNPP